MIENKSQIFLVILKVGIVVYEFVIKLIRHQKKLKKVFQSKSFRFFPF